MPDEFRSKHVAVTSMQNVFTVCVSRSRRQMDLLERISDLLPKCSWISSDPVQWAFLTKAAAVPEKTLSHSLKKDNYFWSESEVGGSWLVFWEINQIETAIFMLIRWTLRQSTSNCFRGEAPKPNALGPSGFSWRRGQNPSIDRCGTMLHHILVPLVRWRLILKIDKR